MSHVDAARRSGHDQHAHADASRPERLKSALMTIARELSFAAESDVQLREAVHAVSAWLSEATAYEAGHRDEQHRSRKTPAHEERPRAEVTDEDLALIVERCQLKAEGSRWAVERDDLLQEGADFATEVRPVDHEIIEQARQLPNCFLWMNQPRSDIRTRSDEYLLLGDCFDALAEAVVTLREALTAGIRGPLFMDIINLVAEAQSGLRVAITTVESHPDTDQQTIYHWLRTRAGEQRFYIARHMKVTDPADPEQCDEWVEKAKSLRGRIAGEKERQERCDALLAEARQHLSRAVSVNSGAEAEWTAAVRAIDALVEAGMAPESTEFRELLMPVLDRIPGDLEMTPRLDQVLDALHRSVSSLPDLAGDDASDPE